MKRAQESGGAKPCAFCAIIQKEEAAEIVFEDDLSFAFLDSRPLFPGHVLLVPKEHLATLGDIPARWIGPFFATARRLSRAVEQALGAEGSFVAINNRVSQAVPHLHVHIVPRRKGDGLKGFFWPRHKYESPEHVARVAQTIRAALARIEE